jgi:transcription initiation factor IIE alpha subunit
MKNIEGSEKGSSTEQCYYTEETKVCPKCGRKVKEIYKAEVITESEAIIKS